MIKSINRIQLIKSQNYYLRIFKSDEYKNPISKLNIVYGVIDPDNGNILIDKAKLDEFNFSPVSVTYAKDHDYYFYRHDVKDVN